MNTPEPLPEHVLNTSLDLFRKENRLTDIHSGKVKTISPEQLRKEVGLDD